ncbi:MAG: flavin reductase family protein [Acidobacteria bacterium]|nr:flavin reductase family protein [Acidobacteriota bacterium]
MIESIVGLAIVDDGGQPRYLRTSTFSETAHHPTSLWLSVARTEAIHPILQRDRRFSLAILHTGQTGEPQFYRQHDRHYVHGALSSTACQVIQQIELDTHTVFIGEMIEGHVTPSKQRNLLNTDRS